jgi:hypothetical protein
LACDGVNFKGKRQFFSWALVFFFIPRYFGTTVFSFSAIFSVLICFFSFTGYQQDILAPHFLRVSIIFSVLILFVVPFIAHGDKHPKPEVAVI